MLLFVLFGHSSERGVAQHAQLYEAAYAATAWRTAHAWCCARRKVTIYFGFERCRHADHRVDALFPR
jgi:hypothetical protein